MNSSFKAAQKVMKPLTSETLRGNWATVLLPIDAARAAFVLPVVTTDSHDEFNQTLAAFYRHLLRRTGRLDGPGHGGTVAAEALVLVSEAFAREGGFDAALSEARNGTQGGLRFVLDRMTEWFKQTQREAHVRYVFREAMSSVDYDAKVAFVRALMKEQAGALPEELLSAPPERFAKAYETLARAYSESRDRMKEAFRKL